MFEEEEELHPVQLRAALRARHRDRRREPRDRSQPVRGPEDGLRTHGIVIAVARGEVTFAASDGQEHTAKVDDGLLRGLGTSLAVGDEVSAQVPPDGPGRVVRVVPRRSRLSRGDPHNPHREKVIVANVDLVGVVSAASDPPLRPRLIDRYLVAVLRGGSRPLVVLNKLDQADPARRVELRALLAPYDALGFPVVACSAETGEGLPALLEAVAGCRVAFVGHSGVGKSRLVEALGASAEVGALAEHGRGRHTTTSSTLYRLPGGTEVIDTPGVRQFAPFRPSLGDLRAAFPELADQGCGFAGCRHDTEPGCGARAAVDAGDLPASRLDSWLRLLAACS